ncbi:MerR family transcriptional regulator [Arthrobacter sp. USHLN218]|uniref:MerR family transcriptional regulator n=1 Tax=Arthrobacter sp. USHLN218 TaxID=3081232 RepID=UPI0030172557
MTEDNGFRWSIGELAKATGLTVRTLHHYDAIGLLSASGRTAAGHRRYTGDDVRRLYQVRALRSLGVPLGEIGALLADPNDGGGPVRSTLARQLAAVMEQTEQLQRLQDQLRAMLRHLDAPDRPGHGDFINILERMTMIENYFTEEQRTELAARRADLGPEAVEAARQQWAGLVEEGLALLDADVPARDARAKDLVGRWDRLGAAFHSGDGTKTAARTMWQENAVVLSDRLPWTVEQLRALVAYLGEVRQVPAEGQ